MAPTLHPCSGCSRHILTSEESCPFCGTALSLAGVTPRATPKGRLSRAALVAFGTLAATPQVACGGTTEDDSTEGDGDGDMTGDGDSGDGDNTAPVYGLSPSGGNSGDGDGLGDGDAPIYGAPPTGGDANLGGMGGETSTGGGVEEGSGGEQLIPIYGIAPRR